MVRFFGVFALCLPLFFLAYVGVLFAGAWMATYGDAERDEAEQKAWKKQVYREATEARRVPRETGRAPRPARGVSTEDANVAAARRAAACDGHNCAHDVRPQVPAWTPYSAP